MTSSDWTIVILYAAAMIGLSLFLSRGQRFQEDYYVGGRNLPWWAIGLSTMATQTSAISFISISAFVALKPGGGLTWLQYELAVPLAMIGVAMLLLPFFRRLGLISVYEYLEHRFGSSVRYLLSAVFLLSRALGTGVGLYASGLVLAVILDLELWITILTMGLITLIYDTIGGIKGVVYSDVVQSVILLAGIFITIGFALEHLDGMGSVLALIPAERWQALDPAWGLFGESAAPFWGFLVGGLFLYMSYYGADQSQVQRELSASSVADTRRSLYLNGFARFPLTLGYVIMGLTLGAPSWPRRISSSIWRDRNTIFWFSRSFSTSSLLAFAGCSSPPCWPPPCPASTRHSTPCPPPPCAIPSSGVAPSLRDASCCSARSRPAAGAWSSPALHSWSAASRMAITVHIVRART